MSDLRPASEQQLCEALASAAQSRQVIALGGGFSKQRMNPAARPAGVTITTGCMRRILQYEPRDLTISVEAGLPFSELSTALAANRQMIPLDPPWFHRATVGGVVSSNTCGPRRRLYGTARDMVIGMSFAKLDGKLAKSGGMVVKNVAGFDLAKLMIGSFGTLAAVSVINFKVTPMPAETRTFVMQFASARTCLAARDAVLRGVLQPAAIDALNPAAARAAGFDGFVLLLEAGGSRTVLDRYSRELPDAGIVEGEAEQRLWTTIREFTPAFVESRPDAHVARVSTTIAETAAVLASTESAIVCRAGSGVSYIHFENADAAKTWTAEHDTKPWRYVFEYGAPATGRGDGSDFDVMKTVKNLFDHFGILNPGRLYGRI